MIVMILGIYLYTIESQEISWLNPEKRNYSFGKT